MNVSRKIVCEVQVTVVTGRMTRNVNVMGGLGTLRCSGQGDAGTPSRSVVNEVASRSFFGVEDASTGTELERTPCYGTLWALVSLPVFDKFPLFFLCPIKLNYVRYQIGYAIHTGSNYVDLTRLCGI